MFDNLTLLIKIQAAFGIMSLQNKQQLMLQSQKSLQKRTSQAITAEKQFFYQSFLFVSLFSMMDIVLLFSVHFKLQIQKQLFELLLTIFNLMLARLFTKERVSMLLEFSYWYYLSGSFILVNLVLKWLLGSFHTLTFFINFVFMTISIRRIALANKLPFLGGFLVYLSIFAVFDGLLWVDIRITMLAPLIISVLLFVKFVRQVKWLIDSLESNLSERQIVYMHYRLQDLSVFATTTLPLYFAFVSEELLPISVFALTCHIFELVFMIFSFNKLVYCRYFRKELYLHQHYIRRTNNCFVVEKSYSEKKRLIIQDIELCSLCNQVQAVMLNKRCLHMCLCFKCFYKLYKKGCKNCLSCQVCRNHTFNAFWIDKSLRTIIGEDENQLIYEVFQGTQFQLSQSDSSVDQQEDQQ